MSADPNPVEQKVEAAPEATQETPVQTEQRSKKRDENFRRMEAKMQEMEAKLRAVEEEKARAAQSHSAPEDSDLMTMGQAKAMLQREAKRIAEETVKQRDLDTLGDRLTAKYSDFNDVVSEDAIDEIRQEHPEIFNSLKANPDPYQKGIAAYKLIKNLGKQDKAKENIKANEKKLEENRSKPNVGSTNASVLSQVTGWVKPTKEQKAAAYADMKANAARRS